jgi:hypothetical protein
MNPFSLEEKFSLIHEHWRPKVVAEWGKNLTTALPCLDASCFACRVPVFRLPIRGREIQFSIHQ